MLSRLMMDSFTIQSNIEPLYDTLITNIILCANYISVKKKKKRFGIKVWYQKRFGIKFKERFCNIFLNVLKTECLY